MRYRILPGLAISVLFFCACGSSAVKSDAGGMAPLEDTCAPVNDCGPSAGAFFDNNKVAEIRITFDPADLQAVVTDLRRQGHEEPLDTWLDVLWGKWKHCGPYENFVPVTMQYKSPDGVGDVTLKNVGMRLRGTKSRGKNEVAGFKLDFEALLPPSDGGGATRRFANESKISVLSIEGDHSLMLQSVAYKLMRDYGDVPAPRANHLKVYVNGAYYALVQNVEEVDDGRFIKHVFKKEEDDGSLYSCSGGCGYDDSFADLEYISDFFADYQTPKKYEQIRGPVGAPEMDLIPMLKCGDVDSTPDEQTFKTCIGEWIDVNEWLKLIAAESLMPSLQSFVGAKRNFYLYFKPDAAAAHGRFLIYSWDYDSALSHESCYPSSCDPFSAVTGWYGPAGTRAKLVQRLTTAFKTEYCAAMNSFLHDAYKPEAVDSIANFIEPVMQAGSFPLVDGVDTEGNVVKRTPITLLDWQTEVMKLRAFIITHGAQVQTQVNAACQAGVTP